MVSDANQTSRKTLARSVVGKESAVNIFPINIEASRTVLFLIDRTRDT